MSEEQKNEAVIFLYVSVTWLMGGDQLIRESLQLQLM